MLIVSRNEHSIIANSRTPVTDVKHGGSITPLLTPVIDTPTSLLYCTKLLIHLDYIH